MKSMIAALFLLCSTIALASDDSSLQKKPVLASAGERLSFVFTIDREGGDDYRQRYLEQSYALVGPLGMSVLGQFPLADKLYGEHKAENLAVFTMPSGQASDDVRNSPEYAPLKTMLAEGWQDMEVIDIDLQEDVQLTLFADRYYTIAKVWVDDAAKHRAYVKRAAETRTKLGIRILASFTPTGYSSLDDSRTAPFALVLVEWPEQAAIQQYLDAPVLAEVREQQGTSIKAIEWYGFRI